MTPTMPPPGMATLWSDGRNLGVTARVIAISDMVGGTSAWTEEAREGQKPIAYYSSVALKAMTLTLRIDADTAPGGDVDADLARLLQMASSDPAYGRPRSVQVVGEHPYGAAQRWRIDPITFDERRTVFGGGAALRWIRVVVPLVEWSLAETTATAVPRRTRDSKGKRRQRVIRTAAGDSMRRIALVELGDQGRWRELREWNPALRKYDPDAQLRVGTKVAVKQ